MKPFRLGLTGSIGMGKSTTAGFLAAEGCAVWDADAAVHRLYAPGGAAVSPVAARFPAALVAGGIDRTRLKPLVTADATALAALEAIVHPLVTADRATFLAACTAPIAVLDIPLLFETGAETQMDATLLVTAPAAVQRARVLARPGMTETAFHAILARQMPDAEKRARATHVVETLSLDSTAAYARALVAHLQSLVPDA
jgi:dephospho-CoA kinase